MLINRKRNQSNQAQNSFSIANAFLSVMMLLGVFVETPLAIVANANPLIAEMEATATEFQTPVAHLEDRLIELEEDRAVLSVELNLLDRGSSAYQAVADSLSEIDAEIAAINNEMNTVLTPEAGWLDDGDDVLDDLEDLDDVHLQYEPFNPYYDEPVERMSDAEIAEFAALPLGESHFARQVTVHEISTHTQLRQFLTGSLGENHDHFILMNNITLTTSTGTAATNANVTGAATTAFFTTGRPGVFTGVFEGNGHTITNLRLRAGTAPDGNVGIGFVQQAGHGAVIRNVNFQTAGTADATRAVNFTTNHARNVGMVVGVTTNEGSPAGTSAIVTLDNVNLPNARLQMLRTGAGTSAGSWGGLVGRVTTGTTLNVLDTEIRNVEFHVNTQDATVNSAGGVVGSVNGGYLNVITTDADEPNTIDIDVRGQGRGSAGTSMGGSGINSGFLHGGGVVGFIFQGHASIENTVVASTRESTTDPIRVLEQAGGIAGGLNVQGTLRLVNVENRAHIQLTRAGGDNVARGRVGGLVGRTAGTLHIYNSRNLGFVQHHGNNAVAGGLLGYAGSSSRVVITGSQNGLPGGNAITSSAGISAIVGGTPHSGMIPLGVGAVAHANSPGGTGAESFTANPTRAQLGGIIGRTRGSVTVIDSANYANVHKHAMNSSAATRNNTRVGGIIGRIHPVGGQHVLIDGARNYGNVSVPGSDGALGGVFGEILAPPRGVARIEVTNTTNRGNVQGGREVGGIIGWSRPRDVTIRNSHNFGDITRRTGTGSRHPQDAGGIIGRAGGAGIVIENATNHGHIMQNASGNAGSRPAARAGGIVGRNVGVRINMLNVENHGNVNARFEGAGILGFANGNDAVINFAVNHGNILVTRSGGRATAGGIVGRSARRNMIIRNAGNFGNITMTTGGNNNMDGVGGILGRSHAANARIEVSFNQGEVRGRSATGGIVGRNQGALHITDVYNTGTIFSTTNRSGNGILGRRRTGNVVITRAWVSAQVGGYAVATNQANAAIQRPTGTVAGITFNGVFIDETTFNSRGTGSNVPFNQGNRPGVTLVDTELLTSGYLPGFSGGPWRIGMEGVDRDDQTTYPYFHWQVPGGALQEPFFGFIRSERTVGDEDRWLPVMDLEFPVNNNEVQFLFRECNDEADHPLSDECIADSTPVAHEGLRVFNTYPANGVGFTAVPDHVLTHQITLNRTGETSIGLIHPNGVIGFETRLVPGRIMIRGYDPLFGEDPDHYFISHAQFEIVSADADEVNLNGRFRDPQPDGPDQMRGLGMITFELDDHFNPTEIISGLNPSGSTITNPSHPTATDLENYTVVRITALGYEPAYRIIYTDDLDSLFRGTINVPMERTPFDIRVWVPQSEQTEDESEWPEAWDDYLPGPPGTAVASPTPNGARQGFGRLNGHTPGSHLAMYPSLNIRTNNVGGTNVSFDHTDTFESGSAYPSGHFEVVSVMWGDTIEATAELHTTNTIEELRFDHLIDRGVNPESAEYDRIKDLDLYVAFIGIPEMSIRFVEVMGFDEEGEPILRALNIDGTNTANSGVNAGIPAGPSPMIRLEDLDINNGANPTPNVDRRITNTPAGHLGIHRPIAADPGTGTNAAQNSTWFNQWFLPNSPNAWSTNAINNHANANGGAPGTFQHFRVSGMTEETTFSVVDETGMFAPLTNAAVIDYFEFFYPLYTVGEETATLLNMSGAVATREAQFEAAEEGDGVLVQTLTIPLIRLVEIDVHVVQEIAPGVYLPIHNSVLTHNNVNVEAHAPGQFTIVDDEFNVLGAEATGFLPRELQVYTGAGVEGACIIPGRATCTALEEMLYESDSDYVRIVLQRPEERNPGYLEGFVWNIGNGAPVEDATILVFDNFGNIVFSRELATNEIGFYSITYAEIEAGIRDTIYEEILALFDREQFETDAAFYAAVDVAFAVELAARGDLLASSVRVMASHPNFTPNWSHHNPVVLAPGGAFADVLLSEADGDSHLLMVTVIDESGAEVAVDSVLIDETALMRDPSGYWRLAADAMMTGQLVVTPTGDQSDYMFIPGLEIEVTDADYIGGVASIVIRRVTNRTVNFDLVGGVPGAYGDANRFNPQVVPFGSFVTEPDPDPVHLDGYTFMYWAARVPAAAESELLEAIWDLLNYTHYEYVRWDFNTPITQNMTLYARWGATVTFDPTDGTIADYDGTATRYVMPGEAIGQGNMPADPTRAGYQFAGWYTTPVEDGEAFDYHTTVETNITVYARWTANDNVRVDFDANGGAPDAYVYVQGGLTIGAANMPEDPERTGYAFVGWFTELEDGIEFDGATTVHAPMTVYARWEITERTLTINNEPLTASPTGQTAGGDMMPGTDVTIVAGSSTDYTFLGWVRGGNAPTSGNISDVPNAILTAEHTFEMPRYNVVYTALWGNENGYIGVPNSHDLTIVNEPVTADPTGQTVSGPRTPGTNVTIEAGTSTDYTFLGWVRGAQAPTSGNISDVPGAILTPEHTFEMPSSAVTYTALWGNEDGYIGVPNSHTLTIMNEPATADPSGQTVGGPRTPGTTVTIESGNSTDYTFLGWVRGEDAPTSGNISDVTDAVTTSTHTFTMPNGNVTYTALWGNENGYIGVPNSHALTIGNEPVTASPTGQTAGGPRTPGTDVTIESGTSADYTFLGWVRGEDAPTSGNISDVPGAITTSEHTFEMPSSPVTYTALWGNEDGYIGVPNSHTLTIANEPATASPTSQTAGGLRTPGTNVTIESGTSVDYTFLGWVRGEDAPTSGNISDVTGAVLTPEHTFVMPNSPITYTALWGNEDGYIGVPNSHTLTIANEPATASPTGQTAGGLRTPGTNVTIEAGTSVDYTFLGWVRGEDAPTSGNISNVPGAITTSEHTFEMPHSAVTYTALWGNEDGYIGIPNSHALTIANEPATASPTGQTVGGPRTPGTNVTIESGTSVDYTFLGWVRGNDAPTSGNISDIPGAITTSEHTFEMPSSAVTYTALWGNEDGYIGIPNSHTLTITNEPVTAEPTGQTAGGPRTPGTSVMIAAGTSENYTFLGWLRGDDVPTSGNISDVTGAITTPIHIFEMPSSNVIYTALWGNEDGYIGVPNSHTLTINNEPTTAAPTGQTVGGLRTPGTNVTIAAGSSANYTFLGWLRGDDVPTSGNISDVSGAILTPEHTFEMPHSAVTYTALWGNEDGYIGVPNSHTLTIANEPATADPSGQTVGGLRTPGTNVTIESGTSVDYTFLGWVRGEDAPTSGNISDVPGAVSTPAHTFVMPHSAVTYTALWGNEDGYIGVPNSHTLTIGNEPTTADPSGQTVGGPRTPGTAVTIEAGTSVDYTFLGWLRGDDVPTSGNISDVTAAVTTPTHTFTMPNGNVAYTALWGNEDGYIGVPNSHALTIANEPATASPTGQTVGGPRTPGANVTIEAGSSADYTFLGWLRGEDVPTSGNISDVTGAILTPEHTFVMPSSAVTYTALWGNEDGYIGIPNSHTLTIANEPTTASPTGQTAGGPRTPGTTVVIGAGTSEHYTFLGWLRGEDVPTSGNISDVSGVITTPIHIFEMPSSAVTYTALWGNEHGYIGIPNSHNLTIANEPMTASPTDQTVGGPRTPGTDVTIVAGSSADYTFLGWLRGVDAPTSGNISEVTGAILTPEHTFVMPHSAVTYTALWGNENGYIGVPNSHTLTIANEPMTATPIGQTASGPRTPGTSVTIESGTSVDYTFLGWVRGDDVPTSGNISEVTDAILTLEHTFEMPSSAVTYTALWGNEDGDIGVPNSHSLTILNEPMTADPSGQTVGGPRTPGTNVTIESGTSVDYTFLGWVRGNDAPTSGNISDVSGAITTPVHTFVMPNGNVAYTALWGNEDGYIGVPNSRMLTIDNEPATANPSGQTVGGLRTPGTDVTIEAGTSADYTFLGWLRGDDAPTSGNISEVTGAISTPEHTFEMPHSAVTYTALWGNEDGYIGIPNSHTLTIANEPVTAAPSGQTVGGPRTPGTSVMVTAGTSENYTFLGWLRGLDAPTSGNISEVTGAITTPIHVFEMPSSAVTYTALWGNEDGYIGIPNSQLLTINNEPATAAPSGQTAGGLRTPGTSVTIESGSSADYTFLGWLRGVDAPTSGNVSDVSGVILTPEHTFEMPHNAVTYTALWGNEDGYIGIPNSHLLTIGNEPAMADPSGQTVGGLRTPGTTVTIAAGTSTDYTFLGWLRGDDVPTSGNISEVAGVITEPVHTFTMPSSAVTYTALWGNEDGDIGVPNSHTLTIGNEPATADPSGQTVGGPRTPGANVTIEAGSSSNYTFLGWLRGVDVPTSGNISDVSDAITTPTHTFVMPNGNVTYTALWGNEDGYIGIPNSHDLTINNEPTTADPSGQTVGGPRTPATAVTIEAGTSSDYTFLGWLRGDDVPTSGNVSEVAGVITTPEHTFTMPHSAVTYTALWGNEDGYIGTPNSHMLTISNEPATADPSGQTVGGLRTPGTNVTIEAGSSSDYTFLGWLRGVDAPTSGNISEVTGVIMTPTHTFVMPSSAVTYTALWGNEDGDIGVPNSHTLTIGNEPATASPTGQTVGGLRTPGTNVTIEAGTSSDYTFLGWVRGNDVPTSGNISEVASVITTPEHTFVMPGNAVTYTALWGNEDGYIGVPNSHLLTINNEPMTADPSGQTAGGLRTPSTTVTIESGTSSDYTFLGWVRGNDVPTSGNISDVPGAITTPEHTFTMPSSAVTYTALWGNEDGDIGVPNSHTLTISNEPVTADPSGQSVGGPRTPGTTVTIEAGTSSDYTFLGWVRGDDVPTSGNVSEVAGAITTPVHTFIMPNGNVAYTALWGNEDGYIGVPNSHTLTINNEPMTADPSGQTVGGPRTPGTTVTIEAGTSTDYTFLGWVRGDNVPTSGNIADVPGAILTPGYTFTMPNSNVTYTALWGNEDGDIGIPNSHTLTINNEPVTVEPTGQTVGGPRTPGTYVTIGAGTSSVYAFLGWVRGDNVPTSGNIADVPGVITTPIHIFEMPNSNVTYTALWGNEDGDIGIPISVYVNYTFDWDAPGVAHVTGQTRYNTTPTAPTPVPPKPGYTFDGWSPILGPITEDTVFVAQWSPVYVRYVFDWNVVGVAPVTGDVRYNTAPIAPTPVPSNPGYEFTGWSPVVNPITEDTTFVAQWDPIYVRYTFDWDTPGVADVTGDVRYNTIPIAPAVAPERPGYVFSTWSPLVGPIFEDTTFVAIWIPVEPDPVYIAYIFDWDIPGLDLIEGTVLYNTTPQIPTTIPSNPGYTFVDWTPYVGPLTEPTWFLAIWEPIYVPYTFNWGLAGEANVSGVVRYNTTPIEPDVIPVNPGYTFGGWDLTVGPIREETVFNAIWEPVPNYEVIVEEDDNGNVTVTIPPIADYDVDDDGNIIVTFPPGTDSDNIDVTVPPGWDYDFDEDEDGNVIVVITPPADDSNYEVIVEEDEDGNVTVTIPPEADYDIDDDGNIIVTFPPGTNPDDVDVTVPPGWDYDFDEDEDGNLIIVITPPADDSNNEIIVEEDEDGNITVTVPPGADYEIDDDGNIIVTMPPGTNPDDVVVTVPPGWDYDIIEDEDGNVIVVIRPPWLDVDGMTPELDPVDPTSPERPVRPEQPETPGRPGGAGKLPETGNVAGPFVIAGLIGVQGLILALRKKLKEERDK